MWLRPGLEEAAQGIDQSEHDAVAISIAVSLKRIADLLQQDIAPAGEDPRIARLTELLKRAKVWIPQNSGTDKGLLAEIEINLRS